MNAAGNQSEAKGDTAIVEDMQSCCQVCKVFGQSLYSAIVVIPEVLDGMILVYLHLWSYQWNLGNSKTFYFIKNSKTYWPCWLISKFCYNKNSERPECANQQNKLIVTMSRGILWIGWDIHHISPIIYHIYQVFLSDKLRLYIYKLYCNIIKYHTCQPRNKNEWFPYYFGSLPCEPGTSSL